MSGDTLHIQNNRTTGKIITVSKTRPADTTTYAAGDVVNESASAGTIWTFPNFAREEGRGALIQSAVLIDAVTQTLKPEFELYLFDTSIVTQNDNTAWGPTDSDMKTCVGVIEFPAALFKTGGAQNGVISRNGLGLYAVCGSASTTLYGIVVARNAYVPTSGEEFTLRLSVVQD